MIKLVGERMSSMLILTHFGFNSRIMEVVLLVPKAWVSLFCDGGA